MGKTQDVDLRAELPIEALKLPPQSEEARELWKKAYEQRTGIPVTDDLLKKAQEKAIVDLEKAPLFRSVTPEEFEKLPRPSEADIQAALDAGRPKDGVAHIPSVKLVHPEQAKDLAVEMVESPSAEITFPDFEKVDIRVGEIKEVDPVPKSNKLLKMEVDFGPLGTRIILAGIAKSYPAPKTLLRGKRFAFVVNLAPREMMGIMSYGMALAAGVPGAVNLLNCGDAAPGSKVG